MSNFEVAVSPHYRGRGWTDRATGIAFEPQNDSRLNTRTISKDMYEDLTGIKNSLRLNHLLLVKGNLDEVTAEKPSKVNPEELSGEELDQLLTEGGGDTSALEAEIQELKSTIVDLEAQIDEFESGVAGASTYSVDSPEPIDREAMKNDNTRDELVAIAEKDGITVDSKDTKADIVDKIADKREK